MRILLRAITTARTVLAAGAILVAAASATAQPGTATAVIVGRVINAATQRSIAGATVLLEERPDLLVESDGDGAFRLENVPHGTYHLLVTAPRFLPQRVEINVAGVLPPLEVELTAELHYSEVISVSAAPRDQFVAYQPTSVLAGQDLAIELQPSLGAALASQPGLSERSFGPAPSRPVIRGLDGDRVLVLEDGQRTGDLSSQSGDHGVTVNPAAATRLEVVRGPAALLYGASAIGGLVNVIHDQIPPHPATGIDGAMLVDFSSAALGGGGATDITWGNGTYAFRAGASGRGNNDVSTPEGDVANTQSRSALGNVGFSRTSSKGYVGASYSYSDSRYGVPVIEEGLVELTPRRHAVTVKGERRELNGFVTGLRGSAAYRRYRHNELVAGDPETTFKNDSVELDLLASHREHGRLKGSIGAWGLVRAFESVGAEALSPPVDQNGLALFLFEELTWSHVTLQFGGRYDREAFDVSGGELPNRTFDNVSASIGLLLRPTEDTAIAVSVARAARNPALEELYFFGPHPGNFAFEVGNPDLESEKALGLDVAFRWRLPRVNGEVAYFRNDITDFIFRRPMTDEEFDDRFGADADGGHGGHDHEGFPIVEYVGDDSLLQGVEAHADVELTPSWVAEIGLDYVHGELTSTSDPLPRMPPLRFIGGLRYHRNGLQIGGDLTVAAKQNRVYPGELPTDGFGLLKLFSSYSFVAGSLVHTVTARLDNATNELYRNHLSLIKDYAAEMGRNFKVIYGVRF